MSGSTSAWELVLDEQMKQVRRFKVPGGWLYQVERDEWSAPGNDGQPSTYHYGWGPPVFVPGPLNKEQP